MLRLETPIVNLRMVGSAYAGRLKKLGIATVGDLLYHLPFRYEDYSLISKINLLQAGKNITVVGTLVNFENAYTKYGKQIQKAKIADETGEIEIVWYNQPYLRNILKQATKLAIAGEVGWFGHKLVFESPEYEFIKDETKPLIHSGRLVPIYPETAGVTSKWLRSRINSIFEKFCPDIKETLPEFLLNRFRLIDKKAALYSIHFPKNLKGKGDAKRRLSFNELVELQLASHLRRNDWLKLKVGHKFKILEYRSDIRSFIAKLPFQLTVDQNKAIGDILTDLARDKPMNRLLEGDVGSGKTVVSAIAMYLAKLNGFQSALLTPTEILATQHYETIKSLLQPYNIKTILLTSSTKNKSRTLEKARYDIFIGTHALLGDKIKIDNLGLIVIDEQQRFGVEQRASLRAKGDHPHVLVLTATPIPRTIALTLYSDLDLSVIETMPTGRKPVKTWVVPPYKRQAAYEWINKHIEGAPHKQQAFIICPLIELSESLESVKAATAEYERLKKGVFPTLKLGLLHGRMKSRDKNKVMEEMKSLKIDILVATPVVEVGIDIASATIMMIEAAERFGLSQLHQLRGRVGRGDFQSYCLLFTQSDKSKTIDRLKLLETTLSGPKLAEYDLKLRGAGEIYGTKQHGAWGLKIADISDTILIEETKKAAQMLLAYDKSLSRFPLLKESLQKYTIKSIAPD